MMLRKNTLTAACATLVFAFTPIASAATMAVNPAKDNTLFYDATGSTSGGIGTGIYSGKTGTNGSGIRRAVMKFDLSGIPIHSTVTAVSLRMSLVRSNSGVQTHTLHRLLADWGEAGSNNFGGFGVAAQPGDATWLYRFFPGSPWTTPGGDFVAAGSASQQISNTLQNYTWTSTALLNDVQSWVSNPATNFGWVLRGNETTNNTAKKFGSRESFADGTAPLLTVTYTPPPPCTADRYPQPSGNAYVDIDDLLYVINNWGQSGPPGTIPPDVNGDGTVNIDDLLAVINQWGPCP